MLRNILRMRGEVAGQPRCVFVVRPATVSINVLIVETERCGAANVSCLNMRSFTCTESGYVKSSSHAPNNTANLRFSVGQGFILRKQL